MSAPRRILVAGAGAVGALAGDDVALPASVRQRRADLTAPLIREDEFAENFFDAMVRRMHARRRSAT